MTQIYRAYVYNPDADSLTQWTMNRQAVAELREFESQTGHAETLVFNPHDFC